MYRIELRDQANPKNIIFRKEHVKDDIELYKFVGEASCWYFFEVQRIDIQDAMHTCWGEKDGSDRILAFTVHKAPDTDKCHRHGFRPNLFAMGTSLDIFGHHVDAELMIFKEDE